MGSLLPGSLNGVPAKPPGVEEFDETTLPEEPKSAGSEYQRNLLRRYSLKGTPIMEVPGRDSGRPSLERHSLGRQGSLSSSPTFQRQGSLRMHARTAPEGSAALARAASIGSPRSPPALGRTSVSSKGEQEKGVEEEREEGRHGWWKDFDSSYLNRQVVEGDEHFKEGTYSPQFGVAGTELHYSVTATREQGRGGGGDGGGGEAREGKPAQ